MLFHVTITHPAEDCPGRRTEDTPALIGDADRREALGQELSVTSHYLVWGAACILWAEAEHIAHGLVEAANVESVERYFVSLLPGGWAIRSLPVFSMPEQIQRVHQILALPVRPEPVEEPMAADTLEGIVVGGPAVEQADSDTVERPRPAAIDTGAVTRFVDSPSVTTSPIADEAAPSEPLTRVNDRPAFSEGSTVILEPEVQRTPVLRLVGSTGPAQGAVFEVGVAGATVGRLPQNSICLTDGRLSRQHARIDFKDGEYWLSDLGSQNGTLVNGRPVTEAYRLRGGDAVELGTSRLTVMFDSDSAE